MYNCNLLCIFTIIHPAEYSEPHTKAEFTVSDLYARMRFIAEWPNV